VRLSVIIPVHNGGENLRLCLDALARSSRPPDQLIVVDDASTDGSGELAQEFGARVLRLPGPPRGAALPRNRGVAMASGDVAVNPQALALMERIMSEHPEIAALFGSYDSSPRAPGLVSRYKNLLHHHVHQHGQREASTFWTGCGAIRRGVFKAAGGFDPSYRAIEDIELGTRLRRSGYRIWLCPEVQATHLKRWTIGGLLRSDIFDRAIPWSRLVLNSVHVPAVLNLDLRSRGSALAAWAAFAFLLMAWQWSWAALAAFVCLTAVVALNLDLYRFFWRQGGAAFAIVSAGLHVLYLLYSSMVFVLVAAQIVLSRALARPARRT
jgi:GT2 family glycosyltransferase